MHNRKRRPEIRKSLHEMKMKKINVSYNDIRRYGALCVKRSLENEIGTTRWELHSSDMRSC